MIQQLLRDESRRRLLQVFLLGFCCTFVFACYTQHAWEDYYITYRASKNLANGEGLVFNVGERLQTYTSPLGVLLPAVSYLLTGRTSDLAALWIYRIMCCLAFGGAAALVCATAARLRQGALLGVLAVGWLCTDSKSLDFTINGMETGFMLLFIAYCYWGLVAPGVTRRWLHLGLAWAGLMWTRPDSFVYIGLMAAGAWLLNDAARSGRTRREMLGEFFKAGAICTVLYLPWFVGSWLYYGSPISHTIVAKSSVSHSPKTANEIITSLLQMPLRMWEGTATPEGSFLPAYYIAGGWPRWLILVARAIGAIAAVLWLTSRVRWEARVASFAFLGAHFYLTFFPYFPFPWYIPPTTLLAFFAFGSVWSQLVENPGRALRHGATALACLLLAGQLWVACATARQMAAFQANIDTGNRQKIGQWLAERSQPGDEVFLEPLGYIGYFSNLKTFDWPGLSSPEVVDAHRRVGSQWSAIIRDLGPRWIVLRPSEIERISGEDFSLLTRAYQPARTFDVGPAVQNLDVRGRALLQLDAKFVVFERQFRSAAFTDIKSKFPGKPFYVTIDGVSMLLNHSPGSVAVAVPRNAKKVRLHFGFPADAYTGEHRTDGATFSVRWTEGKQVIGLHQRTLDPASNEQDRGAIVFEGELPVSLNGQARLILVTEPGKTETKDWACWSAPEFP